VLDLSALQELLADGEGRMGDRVVQWGLMTVDERDTRLQELFSSILTHAMEHPILKMTWVPGSLSGQLSGDLQFRLNHRRLVWDVLQNVRNYQELSELLRREAAWRWKAPKDLLFSLSDLPLNPQIAYALALIGTEPLSYESLSSIANLDAETSGRLIITLWALGGLQLVQGKLPVLNTGDQQNVEPPPVIRRRKGEIGEGAELAKPEPVKEEAKPAPAPEAAPEIEVMLSEEEGDSIELEDTNGGVPSLDSFIEETRSLEMPAVPPPHQTPTVKLPDEPSGPLSPDQQAAAMVKKAQSFVLQDRTSEAIRVLEQVIRLELSDARAFEAWMMLGKLRLTNPAWSTRAISALQTASRLKPKSAEPWALMGELYHRKGFKANAEGCFKKALELDPSVQLPADFGATEPAPKEEEEASQSLLDRIKSILKR
jgi:tetratricopeptide (TPR) repeat protein